MFNISQVLSAYSGLVGWRQNQNPKGVQLSGITTSSSGLWFNKQHPLLTIENLHSIAPDFTEWYDDWASGTTYASGDIVKYSGKYYISGSVGNIGNTPTDGAPWSEHFAFSDWLNTITNDYIISVLTEWLEEKSVLKTAHNLLSNDTLFIHSGSKSLVPKTDQRVGFIIDPRKSESLKITIKSIALQLSANQTLDVKLFQVGNESAIQTESCVYTGSGSVQWFDVDWEIAGDGIYFLVYDEDDLTGQAINGIEGGFDRYGYGSRYGLLPFHKYIQYAPGSTTQADSSIWDIENFAMTYDVNYGLNLKFDVKCDYTQFIIDQKILFKNLIAKGVAIRFLRDLVFNPNANINRKSQNVNFQRNDVLYEIDGDSASIKNQGLKYEYLKAMEAIQFDTANIDEVCLPCKKRGVKYRSIV